MHVCRSTHTLYTYDVVPVVTQVQKRTLVCLVKANKILFQAKSCISAGDGCKNCSFSDKKIILGSIILQTILIIFRGGAIEYLVFLGNGC